MKSIKTLILAAVLALLAGESLAQSRTAPCYFSKGGKRFNVDSGCTNEVKSGGTVLMDAGSLVDLGGPTFSTGLTGNPLVQNNFTDTPVASLTSASMTTLIASTAGTTIYPTGVTIMVSGTAGTATALALECSDGTLLASWPIAALVDSKPVTIGLLTSAAAQDATITTGAALGKGCAASTALMLSNVGTNITTTTHVYTNVQYSTQH